MTTNPYITLIIPARNEEKYLGQCLESVKNQTFKNFEIIVVDNGSTDNTAKVAKNFGVEYIFEKRVGLPRARQTGFQNAKGEIIINIDADCIIPQNYLQSIYDFFTETPDAVATSNPFGYFDGKISTNIFIKCFFFLFNIISKLNIVKFLFGGNFAIRKSILKKIGGFNTEIKFWGEDSDLSKRVAKEGKIYFIPDIVTLTSARRFNRSGLLKTVHVYSRHFITSYFHRQKSKFRDASLLKRFSISLIAFFVFTLLILNDISSSTVFAKATNIRQNISTYANDIRSDSDHSNDLLIILLSSLILLLVDAACNPNSMLFGKVINKVKCKNKEKRVALTFDDGPNGDYTNKVLDILKEEDIKATFFLVGKNVETFPQISKRIINEKHNIGNHSLYHAWLLPFYASNFITKELAETNRIIQQTTGANPKLFRPPHGLRTPKMIKSVKKSNLSMITWANMTYDYMKIAKADRIAKNILRRVRPGSIIVLHDGLNLNHDISRDQTILALKIIIKELKNKGYSFVTL